MDDIAMTFSTKFWPTPSRFPSRERFNFDPAIPNRQLWAIGMVVAQWGMIEMIMHNHVHSLIDDDLALRQQYQSQDSFRQQRMFWLELIKSKIADEAQRAKLEQLVAKVAELKSQRDRIMHQLWAGGMEGTSWSAAGAQTTDAKLMQVHNGAPSWKLTFAGLRRTAMLMAHLNLTLMDATEKK